jgi:hypothetical protein
MVYVETNMMNMLRYVLSFGTLKMSPAVFLSGESSFYYTFECSYYLGVDCGISETAIQQQGSASPL